MKRNTNWMIYGVLISCLVSYKTYMLLLNLKKMIKLEKIYLPKEPSPYQITRIKKLVRFWYYFIDLFKKVEF